MENINRDTGMCHRLPGRDRLVNSRICCTTTSGWHEEKIACLIHIAERLQYGQQRPEPCFLTTETGYRSLVQPPVPKLSSMVTLLGHYMVSLHIWSNGLWIKHHRWPKSGVTFSLLEFLTHTSGWIMISNLNSWSKARDDSPWINHQTKLRNSRGKAQWQWLLIEGSPEERERAEPGESPFSKVLEEVDKCIAIQNRNQKDRTFVGVYFSIFLGTTELTGLSELTLWHTIAPLELTEHSQTSQGCMQDEIAHSQSRFDQNWGRSQNVNFQFDIIDQ